MTAAKSQPTFGRAKVSATSSTYQKKSAAALLPTGARPSAARRPARARDRGTPRVRAPRRHSRANWTPSPAQRGTAAQDPQRRTQTTRRSARWPGVTPGDDRLGRRGEVLREQRLKGLLVPIALIHPAHFPAFRAAAFSGGRAAPRRRAPSFQAPMQSGSSAVSSSISGKTAPAAAPVAAPPIGALPLDPGQGRAHAPEAHPRRGARPAAQSYRPCSA